MSHRTFYAFIADDTLRLWKKCSRLAIILPARQRLIVASRFLVRQQVHIYALAYAKPRDQPGVCHTPLI